jgi:multidrug efflux pump subunit AcrA (membrane-fusion protein)
MRRTHHSKALDLRIGSHPLLVWFVAALVAPGCHSEPEPEYKSASEPMTVQLIHPSIRTITRIVEQPSFIESYERTSVFPKVTGYIQRWNVDIGDKVHEGDVLCTLFVPELVEDYGTKKAKVELDRRDIALAKEVVRVTEADLEAARARLDEAIAILAKYQSEVDRWDTEVKRLKHETDRGVVDPQILLESTNQWRSTVAARDAAKATIVRARAEVNSRDAALSRAKVDVTVAEAALAVAESDARYAKAWVGYLTLSAPYNGVVVARNANTGDFVMPVLGDPTAMQRAPHLAPGGTAAPIYVLDRTDIVRIFVDIPEEDADYVDVGTKASVLVRAYRDQPISGTVTRTSWALNVKSRTLRAEIDLTNPESRLLPGMYAYAETIVERPGVRALPVKALVHRGDKAYYWRYENGKAKRTEVRTGVSDGQWIELTNRERPRAGTKPTGSRSWTPIDGSEEVILGDLSTLTEGTPVRVAPASQHTQLTRADSQETPHTTHSRTSK